jgi:uncharacterized RDD family membrane protein YckC
MGTPGPQAVPDAPAAPVYKLADWGRRFGAQFIDGIVISAVYFALASVTGTTDKNIGMSIVLWLLAITAYAAGMLTYNNGQTFGKRVMGIRVVREDGKPIDLGFAAYRETIGKGVMWLIPFYALIDCIHPLSDEQNRAYHDKLVKSRVVEV